MKKPIVVFSNQDASLENLKLIAKNVALKNNLNWNKIENEIETGDYEDAIMTFLEYFEIK